MRVVGTEPCALSRMTNAGCASLGTGSTLSDATWAAGG